MDIKNHPKEYFAFISYKREDEKWSKWLQNKLEHYKLPSNLNGRTDLPKEIRPVFKDTSELTPGNLPEQIRQALVQSRYLIVICSPRSAKSEWVNKEIETFISMGRTAEIIPFIIEGHAFSSESSDECFPLALRQLPPEQELLGANINEMGRDAAVVKVVARMFDIQFDSLWQRHEREKKRKRNIAIAAASAFILSVLGVAGWIWYQNRELSEKNALINQQNLALDAKTDSLRFANDSIQTQKNALQMAYNDLAQSREELALTNENLLTANYQLAQERDNVRKANHAMQVNFSRLLAEKASALVDDGDNYMARILSLDALESGKYVPELEYALRKSSQFDNAILRGHSDDIWKAVFSPDGKYIASASSDQTVRIWDSQTGACIHTLKGHENTISCVTFSPDGKQVISGSRDKTLRLWDVVTGYCLDVLDGHPSGVEGMQFSFDGKTLVSYSNDLYSSDYGTIIIWDYAQRKLLRKIGREGVKAISPDGKMYAYDSVGEENHVWHICNIETGEEVCSLKGLLDWSELAFSPNGNYIATGGESKDNTIRIWDSTSGECLFKTNNIDESTIYSIAFSSDGKALLAACGGHIYGNKNVIRIWRKDSEYADWIFDEELEGHLSHVYNAMFSPDMLQIASASADHTVRLWDLGMGDTGRTISTGFTHSAMISPDGKYLATTCEEEDTMYIYSEHDAVPIDGKPYTLPAFSPDRTKFASACDDGTIGVWSTYTGKCLMTMTDRHEEACYVAYSPKGNLIASASLDGTIQLWNALNGKCMNTLENEDGDFLSIVFFPNGERLVSSSSDATIRVWNVKSTKCEQIISGHNGPINTVDISANGEYIVSASNDSTIRLWNTKSWNFIRFIGQHNDEVLSARFSPDGRKIVSIASDDIVRVWDVETGICLQTFETPYFPDLGGRGYQISGAMFTPDGLEVMGVYQEGPKNIHFWHYPPLQQLINENRKRFKNRPLTSEERRKFYLDYNY